MMMMVTKLMMIMMMMMTTKIMMILPTVTLFGPKALMSTLSWASDASI